MTRKSNPRSRSRSSSPMNLAAWENVAQACLCQVLQVTRSFRALSAKTQGRPGTGKALKAPKCWSAHVSMVGTVRMRRLNLAYRKKDYATDVLSFPAPSVFQKSAGYLG